MLPVALHSIALIISLFVQALASPLAGAWLFFHISACTLLLFNKKYPLNRGSIWNACLAWLLTIGVSAFLLHPVLKASATMWILIAMPSLALVLHRENIRHYIIAFGTITMLFSLGLIYQKLVNMHYTNFDYEGRIAWPLIDPNNAALVVNTALIPCIWISLFKNERWWVASFVLMFALYATGSKAGFVSLMVNTLIFMVYKNGLGCLLFALLGGVASLTAMFFYRPDIIVSSAATMSERFTIWWCGFRVLEDNMLRGLGLGAWSTFRIQEGETIYVPPTYAHNDLLQFAVEMGIPAALVFLFLMGTVLRSVNRNNIVTFCTIFGMFLQSMVEFQFYLPAVSLIAGLLLATHMVLTRDGEKGILQ